MITILALQLTKCIRQLPAGIDSMGDRVRNIACTAAGLFRRRLRRRRFSNGRRRSLRGFSRSTSLIFVAPLSCLCQIDV